MRHAQFERGTVMFDGRISSSSFSLIAGTESHLDERGVWVVLHSLRELDTYTARRNAFLV